MKNKVNNKQNLVKVFIYLLTKLNEMSGMDLKYSEMLFSKIFDRKKFSREDLELMFQIIMNGDFEMIETHSDRTKLIAGPFIWIINNDDLNIVSISDRSNVL